MAGSRNKPSTDFVLEAVATCLSRHARRNDSIVVGFSGGLDSTVLLHAASRSAATAGMSLSAQHVHHGLNVHADDWAESCRGFCRNLGLPLDVVRIRVPLQSREGIEASARRLRHQALAGVAADWILLAHHADDQAETLLHNLLRGAGVRGAAAMPEVRGRVLRPLLALSKKDLNDYAASHKLAWIEDDSNLDLRFTRNHLRARILPAISERFPKAALQMASAAARFGEVESLLDELATLDLAGGPPEFPLPLVLIRELSDARARNLLRAMLGWHRVQAPDENRLREFVRQLQTAGSDRHPRLDLHEYSLWCKSGRLCFKANA